jgi:hypothetical protein
MICCWELPASKLIEREAQPCVIIHTPLAADPSDMSSAPLGKNWRLWQTAGQILSSKNPDSRAANGGKFLRKGENTDCDNIVQSAPQDVFFAGGACHAAEAG